LFGQWDEKVILSSKECEGQKIRMSLMKDGRSTITNGWKITAETNNLNDGALMAFSFQLVNNEIGMQCIILSHGQ
jgi:hypothetical protein